MVTLLLEAGAIPDGTTVRKPSGGKPYTLRTDIKLYGEGAKVVKTETNIRFLVSHSGDINIVNSETKLAIDLDLEQAIDLLEGLKADYSP